MNTVLVVDDDEAVGKVLALLLEQAGVEAVHVPRAETALRLLDERPFELLLTDLRMPGMDGMALLREVQQRMPELPVVMLTAHGTVPLAVEAMRAGAADFMLKPFDRAEILFTVRKALSRAPRPAMLGDSPATQEVLRVLQKAGRSEATVLLRGETGTGKELAARALHGFSARAAGPLVAVHCASLPESLLESELFGYEKGAFTGAVCRKPGRVELAQGGTLFLDEIGDVPLSMQVKLLRLLQERTYERVGGTETLRADVRFVAATHRDLEAMVRDGSFREDLYYRLDVVPVRLPPLRERPEDIERLAAHFAQGRSFEPAALQRLRGESWPGNVRQLQGFVERLLVFSEGASIALADVERELGRAAPLVGDSLDAQRRSAEKRALEEALTKSHGNRTKAARLLGISRRTLYNKLGEYGL